MSRSAPHISHLSAVLLRGVEAEAGGDRGTSDLGADLHHEDATHRLARGEAKHRGVVLRHRRGNLVLPQIVQRELTLPQRQPRDLDDVIRAWRPRFSCSEQPLTNSHHRWPLAGRESPAAAASWSAICSWFVAIKPTVTRR